MTHQQTRLVRALRIIAGIIGIKIARLAELTNGKIPKNESVDDTGLDLFVYCGLWQAYREWLRENSTYHSVHVSV